MATQLKKIIKEDGSGDYTTLAACMADNEQNLVTANKYLDIEIAGTWLARDPTPVVIENYTTDITRYINIYTTQTARHNGKAAAVSGRNSYRLILTEQAGGTAGIRISSAYVRVTGLEISNYDDDTSFKTLHGIKADNPTNLKAQISRNIIHHCYSGATGSSNGVGISIARENYVYDNIIYAIDRNGIAEIAGYGSNIIIYNNTVYDFNWTASATARGIYVSGNNSNTNIKNNLVIEGTNNEGQCYQIGSGTVATNGSSDATGSVGLQGLTSSEFINAGAGTEDLHLAAGATSIDAGTDLGAGDWAIDIDGRNRHTEGDVWDLGADERLTGAAAYPTSALKKGLVGGYTCFMNAYLNAKVAALIPLKLPDGTVF